jgi:hypothetical protein
MHLVSVLSCQRFEYLLSALVLSRTDECLLHVCSEALRHVPYFDNIHVPDSASSGPENRTAKGQEDPNKNTDNIEDSSNIRGLDCVLWAHADANL